MTEEGERASTAAVMAELNDIGDAVDLAAKVDLVSLDHDELAVAVETVIALEAKLAALGADITRAWERSAEWRRDGHRSAKIALRHRSRLHGGDAHRRVSLARGLPSMPITAELFAAGRISEGHARRLLRASDRAEFVEAEAMLCDHALRLSFADFHSSADRRAQHQDDSRSLHASTTLSDMGRIDAWLDPIGHAAFRGALDRIERELFEEDWRLAREEFGPDATADRLGRTPAQRRADALVEMAHRALTAPADGKRPEPLVIIHADAATFEAALRSLVSDDVPFPEGRRCELDDGTVITPTQMMEQALLGHVRRLVYASPGVILDFGRTQRLFTGALRQAIQARDRRCDHAGCEIPARRCEIDHEIEWRNGGHTTHTNGKARCTFHHRRHKPGR